MADTETTRTAGEAPIGDERHLLAQALPVKRRRGGKHLAHAGSTLGAFVTDDDDIALDDLLTLDRGEGIFLALEHLGRAGELQALHPRDLHDRALGRQRALEADDTAGRRDRRLRVVDHLLVGVPRHFVDVLAERLAGHGHAVEMQQAGLR